MEGDGARQVVEDGNWTRWTIVDRTCTRSELRKRRVAHVILFLNDYICLIVVPKLLIVFGIIIPTLLIDFGTYPKITISFWDDNTKITNRFWDSFQNY